RPVPDDTPGALHVKGESIALGYWCRTDATRAVFRGEWLRTGDSYVRSADGFYTCLGRSNDLLKAGGIWVSPAEVEERLLQPPPSRLPSEAVLDGHVLVDAHVHVPLLPSLAPAWLDWARQFGAPGILEQVWRPDGSPDPARLDELFAAQGVDVALLFCEYSPK